MKGIPLDILQLIYWALLIILTSAGMIILSHILGPKKKNPVKLSPYECGFPPFSDARGRVNLRFYLLAMLFLIFDVEVALLYPWAVVHRSLGFLGFLEIFIFLIIILAGFIYALLRGALEVEREWKE